MKPIPAPSNPEESSIEKSPTSASKLLKSNPSRPNSGNRRTGQGGSHAAYPWLLTASTAVAALFAFLYISKPVFSSNADTTKTGTQEQAEGGSAAETENSLLPTGNRLPGEGDTGEKGAESPTKLTTSPIHARYEETNMRVQHIMTATAADGSVTRIDLEVPVLYQSRNLRWTPEEVARAEDLMVQLMDYQDKSRKLRSHGQQLLADWNALIGSSIPASRLRADSPSIPTNQKGAIVISDSSGDTVNDAVEIQPKDKP